VTRIQIAYVKAGTGHRRAAEALMQAVQERLPHAQVECVDALESATGFAARCYENLYLFLVRRAAFLWSIGYRWLDTRPAHLLLRPIRALWNVTVGQRFAAHLTTNPPDAIICTHFLPSDICASLRRAGKLASRAAVVVTDWHPHQFWACPELDATVVNSAAAAERLQHFGVPRERIHVIGIPVDRAFTRPVDRSAVLKRLDLDPKRATLLLTSGGTTVGRFVEMAERLAALETDLPGSSQLIVVCGTDAAARERLAPVVASAAMPIRVLGFVETMPELMAASDCIVAKAGGLTLSEALACGRPMVIYHVIPGQEEANARYAVNQGAAILEPNPQRAADAVKNLLLDPKAFERLRARAEELGQGNAAQRIASEVVAPLVAHFYETRPEAAR